MQLVNPYVYEQSDELIFVSEAHDKAASTGTSVTVTKPTNTQPGDLMVAVICSRAVSDVTVHADWTAIGAEVDQTATDANAGNAVTMRACYRVCQEGDPASWAFTISPSRFWSSGVITVRGQHASPIDASNIVGGNGPGTSISIAGVTVTNDGSLLLTFATLVGTAYTMPATSRFNNGTAASGRSTCGGSTEAVDSGATGTRDVTSIAGSSAQAAWATAAIAIAPAVVPA